MESPKIDIVRIAPGLDLSQNDLLPLFSVGASGSFASLWRGGIDGQYAIKVFDSDVESKEILREYELLARLEGCHHAASVIALGNFTDMRDVRHGAIIEQYVDGYDLNQILTGSCPKHIFKRSTLSDSQAALIALEIARAIHEIWVMGISHRDLSAKNVMLTTRCLKTDIATAEVYLVDFGQSTFHARSTITPFPTRRLATIPFGAPEIFGGQYAGFRNEACCDVWSLGALIAFTLIGEEFWPPEIVHLRHSHVLNSPDLEDIVSAKSAPIRLELVLGHRLSPLERDLSHFIERCTAFDPRERPTPHVAIQILQRMLEQYGIIEPQASLKPDNMTPLLSFKETVPRIPVPSHGGKHPLSVANRSITPTINPLNWEKRLMRSRLEELLRLEDWPEVFALTDEMIKKFDDEEAMYHRAVCYHYGLGAPEDREAALVLFTKAHNRKLPGATFGLACAYYHGYGCTKNIEKALTLFEQAVNQDYAPAMAALGSLYINRSHSSKALLTSGFQLMERASNLGWSPATADLIHCLLYGIGCETDHKRAFELSKRLVKTNPIEGYALLMQHYDHGWGTTRSEADALKCAEAGFEYDHRFSGILALMYITGYGSPRPIEMAYKMATIAVDEQVADLLDVAYVVLGNCYEQAIGCEKDAHAAFSCYLRAHELGSEKGSYHYALCLYNGIGCKKDVDIAKKLLLSIAEQTENRQLAADCMQRLKN